MNKKLIILFVLILGSSLFYINLSHYIDSPINTKTSKIIVPKGYSVKKIANELAQANIIVHPKVFWLVHRLFFSECSLQAGEYEFPAYSSVRNIINIMHKGQILIHKFTMNEGITTREIINKVLSESALIGEITREYQEGDFISSTYYFTYGETKMMLLDKIYKQSQTIIDQLWEERAPNLPLKNKQEAVILASIVEKETGIAQERPRIAGVFINRLRKNMKLQADPTVIYAVTLGQYSLNRSLTIKDLKFKSPYNTYINLGLPPAPISNPGEAALEAVLNPLATDELYFVATGNGGHNFSSTLNDHNKHVNNYRNIIKESKNE